MQNKVLTRKSYENLKESKWNLLILIHIGIFSKQNDAVSFQVLNLWSMFSFQEVEVLFKRMENYNLCWLMLLASTKLLHSHSKLILLSFERYILGRWRHFDTITKQFAGLFTYFLLSVTFQPFSKTNSFNL